MKKSLKKLRLSRETVRNLGGPEMLRAMGGTVTFGWDCGNNTTQTSATCPTAAFCGTASCAGTCDNSNGADACAPPL